MSTLLMLQSAAHDVHTVVQHVLPMADTPKPGGYNGPAIGTGTPPGADKFSLILGWAKWIFSGAAVLGIIITGTQMALAHRSHGGGSNHLGGLGWITLACVVVGGSLQIVGALS
ncbi:hypothetical protein [Kribbella sp. NPDC048928]|uniref:hypothetical protein n=1 Tax=Kribbella sp. NPDC048928 TaxID=3364111 RepID=UPI00371EAC7E